MWQCPECDSDNLDVQVTTWARLTQTGPDDFYTETDEADDCSHEWGSNNLMLCRDCGHSGKVVEFEAEEETADDDAVPAA